MFLNSTPPFQEIFAIDYLNSRISIENGKAFVNPLICLFLSYSRYSNVFVFYLIFANGFYIGFKFSFYAEYFQLAKFCIAEF